MSNEAAQVLDEYFTEAELATQLKRDVRSLRRWDQMRVGPPRTLLGRTVLYRKESVRDWLLTLEKGSVRGNSRRSAGRRAILKRGRLRVEAKSE